MKHFWILLGILVAGCTQKTEINSFFQEDDSLIENVTSKKTTVSMILPLTGAQATIGENFQKSALLALDEHPDSRVRILFFDTQGTPEGTQEAYKWSVAQKSDIILGPIFASEFKALPTPSLSNEPVLGYTSDSTLLSSERASLALLIPEQVREIVQHNCEAGNKKLAVIGPEGKTGEIVMNSLDKIISTCPGMELKSYALYAPDKPDMSDDIQKILPTFINPRKKDLTEKEKALMATPMKKRLAFDSLLIFEDGAKLAQVMSTLAFYDVTPKVIPIYALSSAKSVKDASLNGLMMFDLPENNFSEKYAAAFGKKPTRLASLAYDSVGWIATASDKGTVSLKTLQKGGAYHGVDGIVKLKSDGTNQRGLRLIKKTTSGIVEIKPAPTELVVSEESSDDEKATPTTESADSASESPAESDESLADF